MRPSRSAGLAIAACLALLTASSCSRDGGQESNGVDKPNIVYILADDLGYGDLSCYNAQSKIRTPHIDKLAAQGMRFTDAHSPSSVCTPTRYGILTGRYCWRSQLPVGVLRGYGRALIEKERPTVASILRARGYRTGVVGKWHLGLDWVLKEGAGSGSSAPGFSMNEYGMVRDMDPAWIDFAIPPSDGPLDHGFDYSFILPASLDMEPYCYLENDTLTALPTAHTEGNDLNTGSYATGAFWRAGIMAPGFDFYEVLPVFVEKSMQFIERNAGGGRPFFLYLPLAAPHTPWVPKDAYAGSSGAGMYGDFVQMVDSQVGRVLDRLEQAGLLKNTVVFFTSDNGPFWKPNFIDRFDHRAAHMYRGMKADAWEGGHRIPFIVRWPGKIKAGSISDLTTDLTNLMGTLADLTGGMKEDRLGEDSHSILDVVLGDEAEFVRHPVVHHSSKGVFAIRIGNWKLIEGLGSGGFSQPVSAEPEPGGPEGQLYNLEVDPSETENLYQINSDIRDSLLLELNRIRRSSRP